MDSRTRLLWKTGDKYRNFLLMQQVVRMDGKIFRKGGIWAISRIHIIVVVEGSMVQQDNVKCE